MRGFQNPKHWNSRHLRACAQTKELRAGQYALDSRYVRARFLTPYYAQFVTALKEGAEAPALDIPPSA